MIDRSLYLDDVSVLTKAYLRRGLAYEHSERYKLAANDLTRVRQMDPMNKQARDSLQRCLKCIKQDEGVDYVPEGADVEHEHEEIKPVKPKVETKVTPQVKMEPQVKPEAKEVKVADQPKPDPEPTPEKKVDFQALID